MHFKNMLSLKKYLIKNFILNSFDMLSQNLFKNLKPKVILIYFKVKKYFIQKYQTYI